MSKQPSVSILVPCYNVEKYLNQCLDSIVNQTLKDIEIICINDGSTDSTLDIIKSYAKSDKRIVIIDKENEGYGKSMNRGLDAATGKYIGIVESDDWVEPDAFEKLYNIAKQNNADLVKAEFVFFDNDTGAQTPSWGIGLDKKFFNKAYCLTKQTPQIIWNGHPSIWTCLYSRKMLNDKNIRFASTPGASFQDMGFKPKTMIASERFVYIPDVVLHYRKHANNSDKNNSKVFAVCDVHDDTDKWFSEHMSDDSRLRKMLHMSRFANYIWNLRRLYGEPKSEFRERFKSEVINIIKSGEIERSYLDDRLLLKLYIVAYPQNIIYRIMRTLLVVIGPLYKNRINNGYKTHILFNRFPIYKQGVK
jgi:glycosyltransferase involved in cell wall biosynthesis